MISLITGRFLNHAVKRRTQKKALTGKKWQSPMSPVWRKMKKFLATFKQHHFWRKFFFQIMFPRTPDTCNHVVNTRQCRRLIIKTSNNTKPPHFVI